MIRSQRSKDRKSPPQVEVPPDFKPSKSTNANGLPGASSALILASVSRLDADISSAD